MLLLALANDTPGPIKFPCGTCNKPVASNQKATCCESCNTWFHTKCTKISNKIYSCMNKIKWEMSPGTALGVACQTYQAFSLTHPTTLTVTATYSPPLTMTRTPSALVQSPATEALEPTPPLAQPNLSPR